MNLTASRLWSGILKNKCGKSETFLFSRRGPTSRDPRWSFPPKETVALRGPFWTSIFSSVPVLQTWFSSRPPNAQNINMAVPLLLFDSKIDINIWNESCMRTADRRNKCKMLRSSINSCCWWRNVNDWGRTHKPPIKTSFDNHIGHLLKDLLINEIRSAKAQKRKF